MSEWALVAVAGFLGGMLNAVAGGGSFITLPALVLVGVPPVMANATGTAALLPGYLAGAWRFRHDIEWPTNLSLLSLVWIAALGGGVGALLLLLGSEQLFSAVIPWLVLVASGLFIVGPRLQTRLLQKPQSSSGKKSTALLLFAVCVYGGYFNGGLGIILLAALTLLGQTNLHGMNGLKNLLSALLTVIAVVIYQAGGLIDGRYLLVMSLAAIAGAYAGAAAAYRLPPTLLRGAIATTGLATALWFFLR